MDYRALVNNPKTQELFRCDHLDVVTMQQECFQLFVLNNDYYMCVSAGEIHGPYPNMLEAFRGLGHIHVKALLKYHGLFSRIEQVMHETDLIV